MMEESRPMVSPDAPRLITEISRLLSAEGVKSYLVGGFIRDRLLKRQTVDIDIAVSASAFEVACRLAGHLQGKFVPLDDASQTARVVLPSAGWQLDFTTLQGDIAQDLARRDFTINAMAIELAKAAAMSSCDLIDPFGGRADLARGIIRAVSGRIFEDDPARLLRAVRFSAELGFTIESATEELIRRDHKLIGRVAGERVREELLRILNLPGAGGHLAYLDRLGVLTALIPELAPGRGVSQPPLHVWDVFEHSLKTVSAAEFLLRENPWEYAGGEILATVPWSPELCRHFDEAISHGSSRRSLIKLAALLHDIAKPRTKTLDEQGRARFFGHAEEGAADAENILIRLRFSHREIELVKLLIKYHLRPTQMSQEGMPTRRAIYRYFRDTGTTGIDLLYLSLADHLATRGRTLDREEWARHTGLVRYVLEQYFALPSPGLPKIIDGHDIMDTFGLAPGPEIGRLLEAVREAQAAGEVKDREEALNYVMHLISRSTNTAINH